jgi:hypothetical protein
MIGVKQNKESPETARAHRNLLMVLRLDFFSGRHILRRFLVEIGNHFLRGRWDWNGTLKDNVAGGNLLAIQTFVGTIVGTDGGTGEGNAGEETAGARIRKYFGAHGDVGGGFCVASLGACSGGGIDTELDLAVDNGLGAAAIHNEKHEVRGLATDLEAKAAALERHHGWSTPWTIKVFAGSASHRTAAIAGAKNESGFHDRGIDDNTVGFIDKVLRNIFGDVHDFLEHRTAIFETLALFSVVGLEGKGEECKSENKRDKLFHKYSPSLDAFVLKIAHSSLQVVD